MEVWALAGQGLDDQGLGAELLDRQAYAPRTLCLWRENTSPQSSQVQGWKALKWAIKYSLRLD